MKFRKFQEWHELSQATYDALQSETSIAIEIKELLTKGYSQMAPNPELTNILVTLRHIYTSITKTNSSAAFMNSDLDHLLVIHEAFESKKSAMRELTKALETATIQANETHTKLISLQQSSNSMDEILLHQRLYDEALQKEEICRRNHDEQQRLYEIEFNNYQTQFIQSLTALLGETAKVRAMNDEYITGLTRQLTDNDVSFSLTFTETDDDIESELTELKQLVAENEERMTNLLTICESGSDQDLVVVTTSEHITTDVDTDLDSADQSKGISLPHEYTITATVSNRS